MLAPVDHMGVADNTAGAVLTEDLSQTYRGNNLAADDGGKHVARPYRGKLIRVAHQDKTRVGGHSLQQRAHQ